MPQLLPCADTGVNGVEPNRRANYLERISNRGIVVSSAETLHPCQGRATLSWAWRSDWVNVLV